MSTLTDKTIADSYGALLHVGAQGTGLGEDKALFQVEDGLGQQTPLAVGTADIAIGVDDSPLLNTFSLSSNGNTSIIAGYDNPEQMNDQPTGEASGGAIYLQSFRNLVQITGVINLSGAPITFDDESGGAAKFDAQSGDDARMIQHHGHLLPGAPSKYSAGLFGRPLKAVYTDRIVHSVESVNVTTGAETGDPDTADVTGVGVSVVRGARPATEKDALEIKLTEALTDGTPENVLVAGQEKYIIIPDLQGDYAQGDAGIKFIRDDNTEIYTFKNVFLETMQKLLVAKFMMLPLAPLGEGDTTPENQWTLVSIQAF